MKTFAYLRVSTDKQELEKNRHDILAFANDRDLGKVEFVEETASGSIHWKRRRVGAVVIAAAKGDTIIVSELSRLGRSMLEVMEILSLLSTKGVHLYALKGNWSLDDSIQSRIIAMVFAMASEIERDLISKRTIESLAARRRAGLPMGRPKGVGKSKLDKFEPEIRGLLANGSTQKFIAQRYEVHEKSLAAWMKRHNIKRPAKAKAQ